MQITIKQVELETALKNYIRKMGITVPVSDIKFTASRSEDQIITHIELGEAEEAPPEQETPTLEVVKDADPRKDAAIDKVTEAAAEALEAEEEKVPDDEEEGTALPEGKSIFGS